MGQRLDRHHVVRLCLLPLVKPFRLSVEAHRKIGRFDEGGDEFVVVLEDIDGPDNAATVANEVDRLIHHNTTQQNRVLQAA